ncbi:hypothetical protein H8959_016471 [Pygathrix nigripes]
MTWYTQRRLGCSQADNLRDCHCSLPAHTRAHHSVPGEILTGVTQAKQVNKRPASCGRGDPFQADLPTRTIAGRRKPWSLSLALFWKESSKAENSPSHMKQARFS